MTNKKFLSGMLIMALVFGTAIIGCENGTNAGANTGSGGGSNDITYTVTANGKADEETSTQLEFTFSADVSGLQVGDFDIFDITGTAKINTSKPIKDIVTGDGTSWKLSITKITAGKIRVQIDKKGIERSRKTLIVHQNTASASTKGEAIELPPDGEWAEGTFEEKGEEKWYKFVAKAGTDYYVQWSENARYGYTAWTYVAAYQSDDTPIFSATLYGPKLVSGVSGTVYLKVQSDWRDPGTFAIRFYDPADMYPMNVIDMWPPEIMFDGSVLISWRGSPEATKDLLGYIVYRCETETGTYEQLTDITDPSIFTYNDTTVTGGKTYWYKVAAYNKKGEGEPTAPSEIEVPREVEIPLTVGADYTEGEFTETSQIDWYSFTAEAGKTYQVQWLGSNDEIPGSNGEDTYRAMLMVTALKDDKTEIEGAMNWTSPVTISGVSGKVYIKAQQFILSGTYAIRVVQQ